MCSGWTQCDAMQAQAQSHCREESAKFWVWVVVLSGGELVDVEEGGGGRGGILDFVLFCCACLCPVVFVCTNCVDCIVLYPNPIVLRLDLAGSGWVCGWITGCHEISNLELPSLALI